MASKTSDYHGSSPPIEYNPKVTYSFEQFEVLNNWLKTHELVIDKVPISHFELEETGKLIPMPQTPIYKEVVVAEIARQIGAWNINSRQNGVITSSQGGFNISITGGRQMRAPDVAFTTRETYRQLSMQQLNTFQGPAFSPVFVVEVEDLTENAKLTSLTSKFKEEYFPAGAGAERALEFEKLPGYEESSRIQGSEERQRGC
ncbi:hypothetical protein BGX26_000671 [Mortierella sp. AD094]|nr:hypothetical protein BGX26_000668 [Mortierella sp. AD094]KAF9347883.1 hypothetical protein BGX26_000671 [Mortierella sp. AD094]